MKKNIFLMLLSIILISGCAAQDNQVVEKEKVISEKNSEQTTNTKPEEVPKKDNSKEDNSKEEIINYDQYKGNWKLKVDEDEELYLMTALDVYYGMTGINITDIQNNKVKGSIYSVTGAPSYRQAEVSFEGEIKDNKLIAPYEDDGWEYSGNLELTFQNDKIAANITRDEVEEPPMWGIPEGEFTFVKSIETEVVNLSEEEKNQLEQFLSPVLKERIQPFTQGELTDKMIIDFVSVNLAEGSFDTSEFGDEIQENAGEIILEESVMNHFANKYFGVDIQKHQSNELAAYADGIYTIPEIGGVSEYPVVQILMKDTNKEGTYYAIVDYMFGAPDEEPGLEYENLIELEENNGYIIRAIKEITSPIDFKMLQELSSNS